MFDLIFTGVGIIIGLSPLGFLVALMFQPIIEGGE